MNNKNIKLVINIKAAAATGLWNNMLEPVGQKSKSWTPGDKLKCPTSDRPYFYTYKNSN